MAHMPNTRLPALTLSPDGKWLHCPQCSKGYWGAFRPTDHVVEKFAAHVERKHKAAEAGVEAPASDHADFVANIVAGVQAQQAKNAAKAPKAPAKAKVARAAAKAAAKGDGEVRIMRDRDDGPKTADLLGQAMADILADVGLGIERNPIIGLAQGPRDFPDERERDRQAARDANRGQDVIARVQAQLSPIKGWA